MLTTAALLAACTGDGDGMITLPSPTASATPAQSADPTHSSSPSPDDPFAVPDEITPEYVERVLNEIARLDAELTRDILRRPLDEDAVQLPPDDRAQLETIYAEPILTFNTRATRALLHDADERDDLHPPDEYGQLRVAVEAVLSSEPCVVARVDRDFTETDEEVDGDTSTLAFVFLVPAERANVTGWQLARLLDSDAAPGSSEEQELRELTAKDLSVEAPEVCS